MIRVKICGMTNAQDAQLAVKLGAWALGFIFYKNSKREIGAFKAKKIISQLPPFVTPVGVFVDQKQGAVKEIAEFCGLKVLQFHGAETPDYCQRFKDYKVIKAFRVSDDFDVAAVRAYKSSVSAFLFDTYSAAEQGGSGKTFNWKLIKSAKDFQVPVILSGGLNPQNIRAAIDEVRPYAVDVCSGVEEAPGKKSERLLQSFFDQLVIPVV